MVPVMYLLTGEDLPLVLVDDSVTGGDGAIFEPSHRSQEVSGISESVSS